MSDEIETIDKNPKSWAAWKREAERLQAIIDDMVLAAMDSESECLPLDYLQGHKDGLEWGAQLAEANHPETGDWLYDDPIELAKAIRKGPDMPPAQPVADSEPVAVIDLANLDYLLSGADADVWPPEREEMGDVLLYRHAQPAPVVPEEMPCGGAADDYHDGYQDGWNACRAAMLTAAPQSPGSEPATMPVIPARLVDSVTEVLRMLDEYPERLVPVNRQSALIRELRSAVLEAASIERGKQ
ncbi:Uncharacterised protein [Klebsiella pneumoniae]|uniref:hypothetical protein n=1 Tax=Klebsiella pneumoniae TaxID=573 RepID=UPI0009CE0C78|nr:hypothetical protein [Klebsiella pneumoniae]SLV35368.1 Uncharacterised protein [Klebsiella pneumoniae]SLV40125.1 Uncharacterised protein [Klebsiella pneumoniae]SLV41767.1 Uncharacterised protein [Klebsiella pneumoniae]SLV55286.1 Uncharacterised protein [Klebsiella pneumoniae]SLV55436.1 Uncharacterised protein [Klebsiella pneumoniae]